MYFSGIKIVSKLVLPSIIISSSLSIYNKNYNNTNTKRDRYFYFYCSSV